VARGQSRVSIQLIQYTVICGPSDVAIHPFYPWGKEFELIGLMSIDYLCILERLNKNETLAPPECPSISNHHYSARVYLDDSQMIRDNAIFATKRMSALRESGLKE